MQLFSNQFAEANNRAIFDFISLRLCADPVIMQNDASVSLEDKVSLSKSVLKLVGEIVNDHDERIDFDSKLYHPGTFVLTFTKVTISCLGVLQHIDCSNGNTLNQETAISLLKKSIKIALHLVHHPCVTRKPG